MPTDALPDTLELPLVSGKPLVRDKSRAWRVGRALVLLLLAMVFTWVSIYLTERLIRPAGLSGAPSVSLYLETETLRSAWTPGPGDKALDVPMSPDEGLYIYRGEPHRGGYFVIDFELDAVPDEYIAFYLQSGKHIVGVKLNNEVVYTRTGDRVDSIHSTDPALYVLPTELLRVGSNQLIIGHPGILTNALSRFGIGAADDFMPAFERGMVLSAQIPWAAITILVLVGMLYIFISWPREERVLARALTGLLFVYALYCGASLYMPPMVSNLWREIVVLFLFYSLISAFCFTVAAWAGAGQRIYRAIAGVTLLVFGTLLVLGLMVPNARGLNPVIAPLDLTIQFGLLPALLLILALNYNKPRIHGGAAAFVLMVCLCTLPFAAADTPLFQLVPFTDAMTISQAPVQRYGLLLGFGLIASVAAQATRARQVVDQHNAILTARLLDQQQQLEIAFSREAEIAQRESIMAERQRLMQDMHDGIGGQLVSLIIQTRSRKADIREVNQSLQQLLDDLRLIVDSLDSAGDHLGYAIGGFRHRIDARLKEAGIELHWNIDRAASTVILGPEKVLQVFRILQEACSNAIQHANASKIEISLSRPAAATPSILLTVRDNGRGLPEGATKGKGLASMRTRSIRFGADLRVTSEEGVYTEIALRIPLPDRAHKTLS